MMTGDSSSVTVVLLELPASSVRRKEAHVGRDASVAHQYGSGDVTGGRRGEEVDGLGLFLGSRQAMQRYRPAQFIEMIGGGLAALENRGERRAGCKHVDSDARGAPNQAQRPGPH